MPEAGDSREVADDVGARVRAELDRLHRSVLDGLRFPVTLAPALVGAFAIFEWLAGKRSPWPILHLIDSVGVAAALWWRSGPVQVRRVAVTAGVTLSSGWALFHYGPLFGAGLFFVCAALAATFFLSKRGVLVVSIALLLFVGLTAWGTRAGWLSPRYAPPDALAWARLWVGCAFLLSACGYVFSRVQGLTRDSLASALFARDERARAEKEREQLQRQGVSAQRLEVVGKFAGGVAHEINNALTGVLTNLELLRGSVPSGSPDRPLLDDAAGKHAASVAKAMLTFARARPEEQGTVAPASSLAHFADGTGRILAKNVSIQVEAQETAAIPLSAPAFEQVLANLALNARDAMPNGGRLTLRCRDVTAEGRVEVDVADDGPGMSDAVRERAFEPFFSTKPGATGLGLSIVWGIVTRAGGMAKVIPQRTPGTCVRLSFPAVPSTDGPPEAAASPSAAARPERILLLEDDAFVRKALTRVLRQGGYEVCSFERAGLAQEAAMRESFDALITDATVPDGGVQALIDAFRSRNPRLPILVCSGSLEEEMPSMGIERGGYRFLRKPVETTALLAALQQRPAA